MLACFGKPRSKRKHDDNDAPGGKAFGQAAARHAHSTWAPAAQARHSLGHLGLSSGARLALTHLSDTLLEAKVYLQLLADWISQDVYLADMLECFHKQVQHPGTLEPRIFSFDVHSSCDTSTCGLPKKLRVHVTHMRSLTLEHVRQGEDSFTRQPVKPACSIDARPEMDEPQGQQHKAGEAPGYQLLSALELEEAKAKAAAEAIAAAAEAKAAAEVIAAAAEAKAAAAEATAAEDTAGAAVAAAPPPQPPPLPLQATAAQDHRRSALMLLEVPASITLLSKDCLVLDQNQGSIEQYGTILGERMLRAKNVDGKAMQDLPVHGDQGVRMSGPLPALLGPSGADKFRDLLQRISMPDAGPWKCIVPVDFPVATLARTRSRERSKSFYNTENKSGCPSPPPSQPRPTSFMVQSNRLASQMTLRDQATGSSGSQQAKSKIRTRHTCIDLMRELPQQQQKQQQQQQQQQKALQHEADTLDELDEALRQQQQQQQQQQQLQHLGTQQARSNADGSAPSAQCAKTHCAPKSSRTLSDLKSIVSNEALPTLSEDEPHGEPACPSTHKHHLPQRRHTFHDFRQKQQQKQRRQEQKMQEAVLAQMGSSGLQGRRRRSTRSSTAESETGPPTHECIRTHATAPPIGLSTVAKKATGLCNGGEGEGSGKGSQSSGGFSPCKRSLRAVVSWGPASFAKGGAQRHSQSELRSKLSNRESREEGSIEPRDALDEQEEMEGGGESEEEMSVEHQEVELVPVVDPVTNEQACLLIQRNVTEQAKLEKLLSQMTEDQLQMLSQIFPRHVIEALSTGVLTTENLAAMAKNHADVTIVFVDIVGFTSMSKDVHAEAVILFLNLLFSRFDRLLAKHQMQKVDIIGDCFIACSGILAPDEDGFMSIDEHHNPSLGARRSLALAIDMMRTAAEVQMPNNEPVRLRIGMHTGPCVSGLMGVENPKWSVFGDTVNTAARMEQTAGETCIQISRTTYDLLPQCTGIELQPSGGVAMKGKGVMETFIWQSPSTWTPFARSSGSTFQVPLSAEQLCKDCFQPEREARQPCSNPSSASILLSRLKRSTKEVPDDFREPSPMSSGHHEKMGKSSSKPLPSVLAAGLHRSLHTRASTTTSGHPSDAGLSTTAANAGLEQADSMSNLQGLVLVDGNDSCTCPAPLGSAFFASQRPGSDSVSPTPFSVMPCALDVPAKASAKEAGPPESGALDTCAPEVRTSEVGTRVAYTFADMPSHRHVTPGSTTPPLDAFPEDLEDSAASHSDKNGRQAASGRALCGSSVAGGMGEVSAGSGRGAAASLQACNVQPSHQHQQSSSKQYQQEHLQQESSRAADHQQEQAGNLTEPRPPPHPAYSQPHALMNACSRTPSPEPLEGPTPAGSATPHILLPMHEASQAGLGTSKSQSPLSPGSPSPLSSTGLLQRQHHHPPQYPANTRLPTRNFITTPNTTPLGFKREASSLSITSMASVESQTESAGGRSAGLPKLDSSNTATEAQESLQCPSSPCGSAYNRHNTFLLHLPPTSVVHTHAALLEAELAQHRRCKKSLASKPRHAAAPKAKSSPGVPPQAPPPDSPAPSPANGLLRPTSQQSLHHPSRGPSAAQTQFGEAKQAEMQTELPQAQPSGRSSFGVRATAAKLTQRVMAQAARPQERLSMERTRQGRRSMEISLHRSCSNAMQSHYVSCSNAVQAPQAALSQEYGLVGVGFEHSSTIDERTSEGWDMNPRAAP